VAPELSSLLARVVMRFVLSFGELIVARRKSAPYFPSA
jgi:hypothetical protein